MTEPIDLQRFKDLRKQLNGSSTDTIIIMQVIALVDHMADYIIDQELELKRLRRRVETLSTIVDNIGEYNE